MQVKCPHCGKQVAWDTANKWRPFCSERCKLVDLGAWIAEEHAIPGEPVQGDPDAPGGPGDRDRPH
jgi:endogenous inhibitor of DNA gyrase (YacG/DUF329 family)